MVINMEYLMTLGTFSNEQLLPQKVAKLYYTLDYVQRIKSGLCYIFFKFFFLSFLLWTKMFSTSPQPFSYKIRRANIFTTSSKNLLSVQGIKDYIFKAQNSIAQQAP